MNRPLLCSLVLSFAVSGAWAQGPPPDSAQPLPFRDRPELQKKLDAYEEQRLKEVLGLSNEEAARIVPMVTELAKERRAFQRARAERTHELVVKSQDASFPEADLEKGLADLRQMERDFLDKQRAREDALLQGLEPRQRIGLLAFREKFPQEVKRKLRELKEEQGIPVDDRPQRRHREGGTLEGEPKSPPAATPPPRS